MLRPNTLALTALLGLLTALGPLSTDMYLPSLPAISVALRADLASVQLTLSVFLLGFAAGQVFYGPFADRYGRRPPLLAGLCLFVLASLLCAVSPTIETLTAARFVQALGASGPIVLARTVVRDLYEGPVAARELSRMGSIMGIVPAIAPVVGGFSQRLLGWPASFVLAAVLGAVGALVVHARLPETIRVRSPGPISPLGILAGYAVIARHGGFLAWLALMSLTYGGLFAYISGSSFVLQGVYGLDELTFAVAFVVGVAGYVSGTLLAQWLVPRAGIERTVSVGVATLAIGGAAMPVLVLTGPGHPAEIVLPMTLYLAGVGLVMPQAMAGALGPFAERAGSASSLAGFVQMLAGALVGVAVGRSLGGSALPLAIAVCLTGLGATAVFLLSRRLRAGAG